MFALFSFGAWMLLLALSGDGSSARLHRTLFFQNPSKSADVVQAASGGSVVLECEAGGNPTPLIRWIRKGQQIVQVTFPFEFNIYIAP